MVGNDIIDLKLAAKQSNWKRPRFLDKIFTQKEQQLILNAQNSFNMVWRLWSMKESAYKIHVQQFKKRFFAPKKMECSIIDSVNGTVCLGNFSVVTTLISSANHMYTSAIAKKQYFHNIIFYIENAYAEAQREIVYSRLKQSIAKREKIDFEILKIKKTPVGVPKIYSKNELLDYSFSLTHHGNFGGICILR